MVTFVGCSGLPFMLIDTEKDIPIQKRCSRDFIAKPGVIVARLATARLNVMFSFSELLRLLLFFLLLLLLLLLLLFGCAFCWKCVAHIFTFLRICECSVRAARFAGVDC